MSESGDYTPAPHWQGVNDNFASARQAYASVKQRTYDDAVQVAATQGIDPNDFVPESITTDSEAPLVICCDFTGSMGTWVEVIVSKFPYLEYEVQEYLGDGVEISLSGVCDAPKKDKWPFQARPFAKRVDLKTQTEKLVVDGNSGGGNGVESYDLAALFYTRNCHMPEAIRKPVFIFICDEGLYEQTHAEDSEKWARVKSKSISIQQLFKELTDKYSVYVIRKPYLCDGDDRSAADIRIEKQWMDLVGEDRVVSLPAADRVVDVIFGCLAKETGRIEYFEKELKDRQGKDKDGDKKIAMVMKSLATMHHLPKQSMKKIDGPKGAKSKSVTPSKNMGNQKSKSLLDD